MEEMDDEVDEVEEHPTTFLESLDVMHRESFFLQLRDDVLTERPHMGIGGSARDEEEIGHVCHSAQIEEYDVLSFVVDGDLCGALGKREGVGGR